MSNYVSVLKLLIKNMFRRDMAKEKSLTKTLLVGLSLLIAYAAIGFLFVTLIYFMGSAFAAKRIYFHDSRLRAYGGIDFRNSYRAYLPVFFKRHRIFLCVAD